MKSYVNLIFAITLIFLFNTAATQVVSLKKMEKAFIIKYNFDRCSKIELDNIYFTQGNVPDSSHMEFRLFVNDKSPLNYNAVLKIGSTNVIYDGDSLITVYSNGIIKQKKATKANLIWLQFMNRKNPFYETKSFFELISSAKISKKDTVNERIIMTLVYLSRKEEVTYRLNVTDTILIYYEKRIIKNSQLLNSFSVSYIAQDDSCINGFENIKKTVLNKAKSIENPKERKRRRFQIGDQFEQRHLSLNGDSIDILSIDKSYYLIDLWYIGCKPCMQAIPYMIEISNEFDFIEVVGLNTMNDDFDFMKSYKKKHKINYTFLVNQSVGMEYYTPYPCFIVLDKNLKIIYIDVGYTPKKIKKLKDFIRTLM